MKLELTGLKLEIEQDSDTVSPAVAALQQQLTGLMQTVNTLASGTQADQNSSNHLPTPVVQKAIEATAVPSPAARSGQRRSSRKSSGTRPKAEALELKHDTNRYGNPKQEWNTATKSMWLLYMLGQQTEHKETSAPVLAETFNRYFKEFGPIISNNVTRDLRTAKKAGHASNNPDKEPQAWFLLDEGKKEVERLIADASTGEPADTE